MLKKISKQECIIIICISIIHSIITVITILISFKDSWGRWDADNDIHSGIIESFCSILSNILVQPLEFVWRFFHLSYLPNFIENILFFVNSILWAIVILIIYKKIKKSMNLKSKQLYILIIFLIVLVFGSKLSADAWYNFDNKNLKIGGKNFKIKGTPFNPVVDSNGSLLFGTGSGFIYKFNKNGLEAICKEKGIFYHVFDFNNKIIALSGSPGNGNGNSNIIIFDNKLKKKKRLFHDNFNGRTSIWYLKNPDDNLLLVNLGGRYWVGNHYFIINCINDEIIWTLEDNSSTVIPYKIIKAGFEFIKAETDELNKFDDKKENLLERYLKIKNIVIEKIIFDNKGKLLNSIIQTNLCEFIDLNKKYSNICAWGEEKIFSDFERENSGISEYIKNLESNNTIKLFSFPELKEESRYNEKVIFKRIN